MKNASLSPRAETGDRRRDKLQLVFTILIAGALINVIWYAFMNFAYTMGYPYNTCFLDPKIRFSDLADTAFISGQPNPYSVPLAVYLPFAWFYLRLFDGLNHSLGIILCFCPALGILLLLLANALRPVIVKPWACAFFSLLLLLISYPILFCFDRGNIEITVAALVAGALYFISRAKPFFATLCLIPAVGFKIYPVLLFILVARRSPKAAAFGLLATMALTLLSLWGLSLSPRAFYEFYSRNMAIFNDYFVYQNLAMESSSSPWNAGKLLLIFAGKWNLIAPVDFSFDAPFIRHAYAVYSIGMLLLAAMIVVYAGFLEKEWRRGAMALLLFLCLAAPNGGDYRLIYAGMAPLLLVLTATRRPFDTAILVLLALTQVPKKLIVFPFAGVTGDGCADVSSGVLIDPILILAAIFLLLYSSRGQIDLRWSWLRLRRTLAFSCA